MAEDLLKAVEDLRGYDHVFLSEEGVNKFSERFGVKLTPAKYYENPRDPKGLTLEDGPEVHKDKRGRYAMGLDAMVMAMSICDQLGVQYMDKMGRGSQLRVCCDALEAHFKEVK